MKESGLADYLVLLSLCHSCRYRGISFLKFLLSRERDMETLTPGKRGAAARDRVIPQRIYPSLPRPFAEKDRPAV